MFKQIKIVNGKPVEVELTSPDPLPADEAAFWSVPHDQHRTLSDGRIKDERTGLILEPVRNLKEDPEVPPYYTRVERHW